MQVGMDSIAAIEVYRLRVAARGCVLAANHNSNSRSKGDSRLDSRYRSLVTHC